MKTNHALSLVIGLLTLTACDPSVSEKAQTLSKDLGIEIQYAANGYDCQYAQFSTFVEKTTALTPEQKKQLADQLKTKKVEKLVFAQDTTGTVLSGDSVTLQLLEYVGNSNYRKIGDKNLVSNIKRDIANPANEIDASQPGQMTVTANVTVDRVVARLYSTTSLEVYDRTDSFDSKEFDNALKDGQIEFTRKNSDVSSSCYNRIDVLETLKNKLK